MVRRLPRRFAPRNDEGGRGFQIADLTYPVAAADFAAENAEIAGKNHLFVVGPVGLKRVARQAFFP
jgi:hypothetical protein